MLGSAPGGPPAPAWLEAEEMAEAGAIPAQLTPHGPGSTVRPPRTLLSSRPHPSPWEKESAENLAGVGWGDWRRQRGPAGVGGEGAWGETPAPCRSCCAQESPPEAPRGVHISCSLCCVLMPGAPTMLAPGPSSSPETAPCVALPHCARALGLLGLVGLSPSWPRWHARL